MTELLVSGIILVVAVFVGAKLTVRHFIAYRLERVRQNYNESVASKYELQNVYDEFGKGDDEDRNPLVQYHDDNPYMQ